MSDESKQETVVDSKVEPQAATVASSPLQRLQAAYQQVAAEYGHAMHILEQHKDTVKVLKARILQFETEFAKVHAAAAAVAEKK